VTRTTNVLQSKLSTAVRQHPRRARPIEPFLLYYVKGMLLGISAYLIGVHLWTWVFTVDTFLAGYADFSRLYTAGYMVRTGRANQLYGGPRQHSVQNNLTLGQDLVFDHAAFEAPLFVPFSLLTIELLI
jgi:hypothetical protein